MTVSDASERGTSEERARTTSTATREERLAEARAYYDGVYAKGLEHLVEARRDTCPWCGSPVLHRRLRSRELIQRKPGRFTLDECRTCGHIFQNPRLSPAGLDFYYRDFYDGLGTDISEAMFAYGTELNAARARSVSAHIDATSWLDVGTGRGHFPLHARAVLPAVSFDGLDMGEGVEYAQLEGRVRHGFRNSFPEIAPQLAGAYDVVSMHHYLEHTRDPRAELDALASTVRPGGFAEIEMPNVFPRYGHPLRSLWVPWLQPQHQHFIPQANLLAALVERGFTPVSVENFTAHNPLDLTFVAVFAVTAFAPDPQAPWAPVRRGAWRVQRHAWAWTTAYPAMAKFTLRADGELARALRHIDRGNAYRIVARRDAP